MGMSRADAGAVVLGGDYRGLGIVRSLGRRAVPVWVVHDDDAIATHSRYCTGRTRLVPGEDAVDTLLDLAERRGLADWVLFPTSDQSAHAVADADDRLGKRFVLTTAPRPLYQDAADKRSALRIAQAAGVPVPRTWLPNDAAEVDGLDVEFPVIVKPAVRLSINDLTYAKAWPADDRAELSARYREASALMAPGEVMIQELIPGGGAAQLSFAAVCHDGVALAWLTAVRARQYPTQFGRASTFVETTDRPDVAELSGRLLAALGLSGLVEIEYKQDPRDGLVKLLDVNARVWGWHGIGAAAGVDFAYLAYRLALGKPIAPAQGSPGVRWVRLSVDLPVALREALAGRQPVRSYLRSLRPPLDGPVMARDDPLPALLDAPLLAATVLRRRFAR